MAAVSLISRLKSLRKGAGLTLKALGERLGYSKPQVANVEAGRTKPSRRYLERFAEAFGLSLAGLMADVIPIGRFRRPKLLNKTAGATVRAFGFRQPPVPVPALGVAFRSASRYLLGPSLLEGLNSQRSRPAAFWDAIKVLAGYLNGLEQMGFLHVLDASSALLDLHPHRLGFRRSVIAEFGRRWLAVELCEEDGRILLYPQLAVVGESRAWYRLDFLAAVRRGGRTSFIDIELDGKPWHQDPRRDQARAEDLGLATVRFDESAVDRMDFRHRLVKECWRVHGEVKGSAAERRAG